MFCEIYKLISEYQVTRFDLPSERSYCCGCEDMSAALFFHGMEISPEVDARRIYGVVLAMPCEYHYINAVDLACGQRR